MVQSGIKMCVRFNSCLRKSFLSCLVVLSASVSGFEYLEPPDEPVELSRRAEVNATSCGSGSNCSFSTLCTSRNIAEPYFVKILDSVKKNCTENSIPSESSVPSHVSKTNGYISSTSSNRDICNGTIKRFVSTRTDTGISFWMFIPTPTTQNCDLFKIKRGSLEKQVKINYSTGGSFLYILNSNSRFNPAAEFNGNQWIHIFLRTEDVSSSSVFIDGELHSSVSNTDLLANPDAVDMNIGCDLTILDFRFYNKYLTNREIKDEIYGGVNLSTIPISYPECRCPPTHPALVRDTDDPSGVFCRSRSNSEVTRLSSGAVDNLRDDSPSTYWTSSSSDDVPTVFFMFDQVFMIDNVSIEFRSSLPDNVEIMLYAGNKEMNSGKFSSNLPNPFTWTLRIDPGPSENSTRSEVEKMVADKIVIKMSKKPTTSIQIRDINIFGRCYCKGSSNSSCKIVGRNFNCTCETNRNVLGVGCEKCSSGSYRDRDVFTCGKSCNCDPKGTLSGKQNDCEADEGQCPCKMNVEGRPCDVCKPLYFDLNQSNTNGCKRCDCDEGTELCNVVTGSCTCKNNVESNSGRCQSCIPLHYNVAGPACIPCQCNQSGVSNSNLQCSEPNGNCSCKSKVTGRACDQCMDEYYNLVGDNSQGCSPCYCSKVGRLSKICDKGPKGVCTCRGNHRSEDNRACDPVFLSDSLDPPFGPESGNTIVTVRGHLFRSSESGVTTNFSIDDLYMPLLSMTDETIQFQTPAHLVGPVTLKLRWSKAYEKPGSVDFLKEFNFEYRPNPVVTTVQAIDAFASGGCKISIKGNNLDSVGKPKLIVYLNGVRQVKKEDCAPVSSAEIHCNSPSGFTKGTELRYGLELDGTTKYENYSMFDTSKIKIVIDPVPTREDGEVLEYKPVFKTEVAIEGQEYTSGCSRSDFVVIINASSANYTCPIKSLEKEMIKCEPDIDFPGVNEEAWIMLFIGGKAYPIQRVKLHTFWNTWEFILIAVGGSLVILLAIFLPVFICCCCRSKKLQTLNPEVKNDFTPLNAPGGIEMDNHQPRGRPNSYVGVQLETEHWDSFVHKINQSVRKQLAFSRVHKSEIVVGTRCIKKGTDIRIVNGNYATDTGKPNAGKPNMIKTLVNTYSSFDTDLLPDWVNSGLQECLRLRDFCDDNVLQMQGVATDGDRFFVLYPGYKRSLKDYLLDNSITPTKANLLGMCVQLMEGVLFLHNNDIVHKDLAARNCVVDEDGVAKVSDAAFSWNLYPEEYMYDHRREKYLPVRWMAPESLTAGFYDTASDVWSFGVLVWEIMSLSMCLPYHDKEENEKIKEYVVDLGFRLGQPAHASDALYHEVMLRCWENQGAQRPKLSDICDIFEQIQNPNADPDQAIYFNGPVSDLDDGQNVYYNYGMDPSPAI